MQELDDISLLREYVHHESEDAFAALVARHVNKVYSIALRHARNPHQAEEITQAVLSFWQGKPATCAVGSSSPAGYITQRD
jgi:DNA-directed RNA polymerase specialized sigma24 family protein